MVKAHVSVFTKLLEGRYDDQLHWPFLGTVTYELLNQLADDQHIKMLSIFNASVDIRPGNSIGHHKFLRHSSLFHDPAVNTRYLLDDTHFT